MDGQIRRNRGDLIRVQHSMKWLWLTLCLSVIAACQAAGTPVPSPTGSAPPVASPSGSASPEPTAGGGVDQLVSDLTAAGVQAKVGGNFATEPIGGEGFLVCVGKEAVQVYLFRDNDAARALASKIDPKDPSKIGTSIVDWVGTPRFWLRDRIVILYLGQDVPTEAALRALLGEPFAKAAVGGPPPLQGPDCQ